MRLELLLSFEEPFTIPYNYPHPLYSFLVRAIELGDPIIARRIHDNRKDIKFVASRIIPLGDTRTTVEGLEVESGEVKLFVGSPAWPVLEALVNGLALGAGRLHLSGRRLIWADSKPREIPTRLSGRKLRTLSPVNVYHNSPPNGFRSWDLSPVGQSNSPFEDEPALWKELVFRNLREKYLMVHGELFEGDFGIEVFPKSARSKMFRIKRDDKTGKYTKVRAWHFEFRMWGDEELLRVAWDMGLGMRNPHGFGMVEVR
ncbi:CRISPR-associated endoribonuclease Cas6 [Thermococcus sp. M36]|uniref:CRISPR-associated endoribonuclease Cas6 n=1 Tax=Thermococcus sp. M36 TaxID=1638261 RepID=UPI00143B3C9E|nr:CRISPR-associated endoribonuclease Cas6 [Thermococcus sp. M36]NJE06343.1 CRISPR-associated endoribonuclease Cas6 [Thermococcus sp. M36]